MRRKETGQKEIGRENERQNKTHWSRYIRYPFYSIGLLEEFINYIEDPERPHREWIFQIIIMLAALSCFLKLLL